MKARALRARFSKSLANQRQRLSRAKVLSTTHRPGRALKPRAASERLTILIASGGMTFATALRNCGPGSRHRRKAWPEKDKGHTASRAPERRRRDPEHRRHEPGQGSAKPRRRPGHGASCHWFCCPRHAPWDRCRSAFPGALHALAVDDAGRPAGGPANLLAACPAQRVTGRVPCSVVILIPALQAARHGPSRRQAFGQGAPRAAGAQDRQDAGEDVPLINVPLAAATLGAWISGLACDPSTSARSLGRRRGLRS